MRLSMDTEAIDRDMSSWVVTCELGGIRLYLTIESTMWGDMQSSGML